MTHTVPIPPDAQMEPLLRRYEQAIAGRRRATTIGMAVLIAAVIVSCWGAEVAPITFITHIGNFFDYFGHLLHLDDGALVFTEPAEWYWGLAKWSRLLGETILIAYVATLSGFIFAFCACFLVSANLVQSAVLRLTVRRVLEFCRTVPDMVFAMLFVLAFGLGPLPGVLAIAIHTTGALGKLYSEVVESIDMKPVEGIAACGGSWFARIRYGVLPQVLSNFASYALLRFEINVRGATVIGFVGAGGIGQELITAIREFYYPDVSAVLVMIVVCVMVIDTASARLRHRLLAMEGGR